MKLPIDDIAAIIATIIALILMIVLLANIWSTSNYDKNMENCMDNGHSQQTCAGYLK
jgi:hypothetical protein